MPDKKAWGICSDRLCNKWAEAPEGFNESKHFLRCVSCGSLMYLDYNDPLLVGYRTADKTTATLAKAPKH
jgi:hypothetical protein